MGIVQRRIGSAPRACSCRHLLLHHNEHMTDGHAWSGDVPPLPEGRSADWIAVNGTHNQRWHVAGDDSLELMNESINALADSGDEVLAGSLLSRYTLTREQVALISDRYPQLEPIAQLHEHAPAALKLRAELWKLLPFSLLAFLDEVNATDAERTALLNAHDNTIGPDSTTLGETRGGIRGAGS